MKARLPDYEGQIVRDGVKVAYYLYENDGPTILLMPTWSIVHSRHWKAQLPYLARHFRVITFDGRGNGASDRPKDSEAYADREFVADALAVLDATGTSHAVLAGVSSGAHWSLLFASLHPERTSGMVLIGPSTNLIAVPRPPTRLSLSFEDRLESTEGWAKYNQHYWRSSYREFVEWFFAEALSEPHSTKQREDATDWALETDSETLIAFEFADHSEDALPETMLNGITCPVLVVHGTSDRISSYEKGAALARATRGTLLTIEGGGHLPQARDPVIVNRAIKTFVDHVAAGSKAVA
jgi:pimeloyl-ACP methyl ester carboxylesterase